MSACSPIDRLMQTIRVAAPGATDGLIQLQVFNVLDEFFRRTSTWRYMNDITLIENTQEYDLAVPADAVVVRAIEVGHNGLPVPAAGSTGGATMTSLGRIVPEMIFPDGDATYDPDASDLSAGVFSYAIYRPDYITLTTPPDVEMQKYPLSVVLALSLAKSCLECDCGDWAIEEWMHDMFFQDWLDGTLGRLYAMPAKPWTSKDLMIYHSKRFRNAMAFRKQEANRGYSYARAARPMFPRSGWI
jgi:hypothetical protein